MPKQSLAQMLCNDKGAPRPLLANVITALRCSPWTGVLAFNEFSLYVVTKKACPFEKEVGSDWTDADDVLATDWMQHAGISVRENIVSAAVQVVAKENSFHPVRDYLNGLVWDQKPRIDGWLVDYLGCPDTPYVRAVGKCWLISGVARIYRPGCQVDHTLMLQGPQGIKKSTALRTLAGDEWFTDHISDLQNKDSRLELRGKWIVEFAEMDRLRRAEAERIKSFLTTRVDSFRPPYGRRIESFPRESIFAASTNEDTPFTDPTGNRRFWPVECGEIDVDAIECSRDQLWAEARFEFERGTGWWLETKGLIDAATEEQESRYDAGVWSDAIALWVDNPKPRYGQDGVPLGPMSSTRDQVTITDVLVHGIGKPIDRLTQADKNQVGAVFASWRWRRRRIGERDQREYFYVRPPEAKP
jgi:predicted P-loop ATPase